ncbi:hypothetical protein BofuT4_P146380.1 [Botrytis cinerea T4]|uniref:Uncharacterized protein n=1 Tax=Botryotinia fuckeliana (strain T4) TaxID=999810 RepID=G2YXX1_BOTF4|nr:hypothetical protein BofuT4_P146380.1 [Botrytis cinerea T4]
MLLRFHWLALWLSFLTAQVASKSISGAYEKIWFYYVYELAWKLDGSKQTAILPWLTRNNQITPKNNGNKGKDPTMNGQLNFQEFMNHMAIDVKEPVEVILNTEDLDATAMSLWRGGFGGAVRVGIATNTGAGTATTKVTSYNKFIEDLMGVVTRARKTLGADQVSDAMSQMDKLLKSIITIRSREFRLDYLGRDIIAAFPGTTVTYVDVPDPREDPATGKTIQAVDVTATFRDPRNTAPIMSQFGPGDQSAANFIEWVDNYGVADRNGPKYKPAAIAHRTVLDLWASVKDQINRPVC